MTKLTIFALLLLAFQLPAARCYRLPTTITPFHYEIRLTIPRDTLTVVSDDFSGTALIHFNLTETTSEIKLHTSNNFITITSIELNTTVLPPTSYSINTTTDILTINPAPVELEVGVVYSLLISYDAQLSSDMQGFYKSSYVDADGGHLLVSTQFQPTYARRAFPCWDEPSFKATFKIYIIFPTELNALSNTVGTVTSADPISRLKTIQFETTPLMSTYLVAFVISEFTCTPGESIGPTPYRVCSQPDAASRREWAVEIGPRILASLNAFTDYNYSTTIEKLDQVAVPDLTFGAMENWGLVIHRETALLWDPEVSTNSNWQSVAALIAHEFTHMWFGNLVTCNWWGVTFLNEGFAQFFQYYVLDDVLPEWELKKQFVVSVLHGILDTDSYITAQALQSEASTPAEVQNKFGSITYSKGSSILRMVEQTMGATNFREGLRYYLRQYQYTSTTPQDLWTTLNGYVNNSLSNLPTDLNQIMQNWVESSGYPLLTVTLSGSVVTITQERFLLSGADTTSKWYVPISYTTSVDSNKFETTTPSVWLTPTNEIALNLQGNPNWIILNNQQSGYFRVNYDPLLWTSIATALSSPNFSDIPDLNRAQIIDDLFNLAKIDKIQYSKVFQVLEFLQNDVSYYSWHRAFNGFSYLIGRLGQDSEIGKAMVGHLSRLMANLYQSVPVTNVDETNQIYTLTHVSAVNWACRVGIENCVNSVKEAFNAYKVSGTRVNKNLKNIVYCNALRYSEDSSDWNFLWESYLSNEVATERSAIITALGCSRDEATLHSYLANAIDATSGIRLEDATSVFSAVYGGNAGGVDVAFNFFIQHHEAIDSYFQGGNNLTNILSGITSRFTNQDQITQLENFIATGNLGEALLAAATRALSTAQANTAWISEYRSDLNDYYGLNEEDIEDEVDEAESTLPEYRLSSLFKPSHYDINLNISREAFTATGNSFNGLVSIYFNTTRYSSFIKLHSSSADNTILSVNLNGQDIPSGNYSVNSTTDIMTISVGDGLRPDTLYMLTIRYDGTIRDSGGLFKRNYVNSENVTKYLLATQFEPANARRMFPCFDEPSFKASFKVLITYPEELNAMSNTVGNIIDTDPESNLATIQFDETAVMSTYLLVIAISDYTCTQGDNVDTAAFRVCSKEEESQNRAWAIEVGPKFLASLNAYTGYNYSYAMDKMDNIALPGFGGAMENWGLVTYGEESLLWDPEVSTNSAKQSIATIIAHEFAHMWFGNLVTCKWWSEIFLNEGFAQYFMYFTAHDVLPDWELDKQFVIVVHQPVLSTDSYLSSQALQSPASTPAQISNKFGSVTYSKGASVIRMVQNFMGAERFRAGLQSYLTTHQFNNTKPEDLWTALSPHIDNDISHLPTDLESMMENWIKTGGYPLLHVSIVRDNIQVTQERFLLTGEDTSSTWYVPISYTTSADEDKFASTAPRAWLTPASSLRLNYPTGADWVVLNNHQSAFYRVHYSDALWDSLAVALRVANFSEIPDLNRAQIVDDVFELTKIDRMSYTRAFRVIEFLEQDVSYYSWYPAYSEFNSLFAKVGLTTRLGRAMHAHVLQLVSNFYDSVPVTVIDHDNQVYSLKQVIAVNLACRLGQTNCVAGVRDIFNNFTTNGDLPPKNLKNIVYCNGIRHSTSQADWDRLFDIYRANERVSERSLLVQGLGCSANEDILREYLLRSITADSGVLSGDTSSIFSAVYSSHHGVDVALQFVVENYSAMYEFLQSWSSVGSIISGIAERLTTQEQLAQLEAMLATGVVDPQLAPTLIEAINTARENVNWVETYKNDFYEYYGLEQDTTTSIPTTTLPTTTQAPTTPAGATAVSASIVLVLAFVFSNFYFK